MSLPNSVIVQANYNNAVKCMLIFRTLQSCFLLLVLALPALLAFSVPPVQVVAIWVLCALFFTGAHFSRLHYRKLAEELAPIIKQ